MSYSKLDCGVLYRRFTSIYPFATNLHRHPDHSREPQCLREGPLVDCKCEDRAYHVSLSARLNAKRPESPTVLIPPPPSLLLPTNLLIAVHFVFCGFLCSEEFHKMTLAFFGSLARTPNPNAVVVLQ